MFIVVFIKAKSTIFFSNLVGIFFVQMQDTSFGYDVKNNAISLAIESKQTYIYTNEHNNEHNNSSWPNYVVIY